MNKKRICSLFNWTGSLVSLWLMLLPIFYTFSVILNILIPILAIHYAYKNPESVRTELSIKVKRPLPSIGFGILLPSFALTIRGLSDIQILEYKFILISAFVIGVPILVFLSYGFRQRVNYIIGLLFIFTFGIGTSILTNALLDTSKPLYYKSKIISKEIEKGKITSYKVEFEPWGSITKNDYMYIPKARFDNLAVNDSITLVQRSGFLKAPWVSKQ